MDDIINANHHDSMLEFSSSESYKTIQTVEANYMPEKEATKDVQDICNLVK